MVSPKPKLPNPKPQTLSPLALKPQQPHKDTAEVRGVPDSPLSLMEGDVRGSSCFRVPLVIIVLVIIIIIITIIMISLSAMKVTTTATSERVWRRSHIHHDDDRETHKP